MSLRVENLTFAYPHGQPVLHGLDLEIEPGRVTGLFGPNGCGKSTLLRCLNGALRPQSGAVLLDNAPIAHRTPREMATRIAVVPQETPSSVPFTVFEMVMLGRFARQDAWGRQSAEDVRVVNQSLERVGARTLSDRHFNQLSGGERQRVVIARALAQEANVLLLDEPASHLDVAHQLELFRLARVLAGEERAVVMVCHDLFLAPMFADHVVLMKEGRIFSSGPAPSVLTPQAMSAVYGVELKLDWPAPKKVMAEIPPEKTPESGRD